MSARELGSSRREFVKRVSQLTTVASLGALVPAATAAATPAEASGAMPAERWDLSWLERLATATDRAVFDWASLGPPSDAIVLQIAARYLDNCEAVYAPQKYEARVVLNIRTQAVPAALSDAAWERYALGESYSVKDPNTQATAVRNPFWHRAPDPLPGIVLPSLADIVQRGAIILVCDFALGHLAKRLADKSGRPVAAVHDDLRSSFVPGSFAVPSGIFGLAKAQNAGCAFVRM